VVKPERNVTAAGLLCLTKNAHQDLQLLNFYFHPRLKKVRDRLLTFDFGSLFPVLAISVIFFTTLQDHKNSTRHQG
jgi:hypothetical protein